jgi:hypothetical protein
MDRKSDMELTLTLSQSGALYLAHHGAAKRRVRFFGGSRRRLEFSHPTSADGLSPTRTSQGDFIPTTGGNPFN